MSNVDAVMSSSDVKMQSATKIMIQLFDDLWENR